MTETVYQRKKTKYLSCFYNTIDFVVPKNIRPNSTHYFILKIPNKREFQQTTFNHWSDTLWIFTKKCTAKPYSVLAIDTSSKSDNSLCFRKNLLGRMETLSALSSDKINKYQYLTDEEILLPDQNRVI